MCLKAQSPVLPELCSNRNVGVVQNCVSLLDVERGQEGLPVSVLLMVVEEGAKGLAATRELKGELPFAKHMEVDDDVSFLVVLRVLRDALISALHMVVDVDVVMKIAPVLLEENLVCV